MAAISDTRPNRGGRLRRLVVAALALAVAAPGLAEPVVTLRIARDAPGPVIARDIFGQFAEHLGTGIYGGVWVGPKSPIPNVRGIRSDVVAALRALRVPNVRWPGGCYADEYHWRDGIGPAAGRTRTLNASWGGVIEPNAFGTDEYMDFLQQIGADAYVSVNIGSGSPKEAADWLDYMTADKPTSLAALRAANGHPAPYRVKYLGLGNENWGCGGAMSADHYVEQMKQYAHYARDLDTARPKGEAMRRIAVGWDGLDADYTEAVMKAWKSKAWSWDIDGVSLHNYATGGWPPHLASSDFGEGDYLSLLADGMAMDGKIAKQSAIMDRYDPEKKLALVVDEWGAWLKPNAGSNPGFLQQQNSLRDALLAAETLAIFIRHADRVRMANIAQMANVLQSMVLTDGPRMVLTPTYHVYKMFVPFQDARLVPVAVQGQPRLAANPAIPRVDAVAARDAAGRLWLAVTNLDPAAPAEIRLEGLRAADAAGQILTAPRVDAFNSFAAPDLVRPTPFAATARGGVLTLRMPAHAVTVLAVRETR
ncbi:alpha-N-arabinofuranosidase [Sphingomonas morindae]|uniref:non-reducing end alpha-L-arabinofuranosidase n=1 Tax=Sphingomonas morindae TaxID=1541170 RepID=A0ABY4X7A1_9SPHN|nr:alpha-L-arabinofuranosidase C-terminal domain-containing protein [Sphingomonas morindae]USI72774.1 alpha-N-arabinofuranosidase [Sphingomonas morindae]